MGTEETPKPSETTISAAPTTSTPTASTIPAATTSAPNATTTPTDTAESGETSTNIKNPEAGKLAPLKEKPKLKPIDVAGDWVKLSNGMIDDITQGGTEAFGKLASHAAQYYINSVTPDDLEKHAEHYKDRPLQLFIKELLLFNMSPELGLKYRADINESIKNLEDLKNYDNTDKKDLNSFNQLSLATQTVILDRPETQKEMSAFKNESNEVRELALNEQKLSPQAFQGLKNLDSQKQAVNDAEDALQKLKDNPVSANASEKVKQAAEQEVKNAEASLKAAKETLANTEQKLEAASDKLTPYEQAENKLMIAELKLPAAIENNKLANQAANEAHKAFREDEGNPNLKAAYDQALNEAHAANNALGAAYKEIESIVDSNSKASIFSDTLNVGSDSEEVISPLYSKQTPAEVEDPDKSSGVTYNALSPVPSTNMGFKHGEIASNADKPEQDKTPANTPPKSFEDAISPQTPSLS